MGGNRMGRGMMMGGGMGRNQSLPNGARFSVFKIKVTQQVKKSRPLPEKLSEPGRPVPFPPVCALRVRAFRLCLPYPLFFERRGYRNGKHGLLSGAASDLYPPFVCLHDLVDNGET